MKNANISFQYELPSTPACICDYYGCLSNSGTSFQISSETSSLVISSIDKIVTQWLIVIEERSWFSRV